jgi:hypothetical protein
MHVFDFLLDEPSQLRYNYVLHYNTLSPNILRLIVLYPARAGKVWDGDSTTAITPGSSNRQDMRLWTVESGFESLPRNVP